MNHPGQLLDNRILARLPKASLDRLQPFLEPLELALGHVVEEAGPPMRHAYFPASATLMWLGKDMGGLTAEISIVGREGMVGIAAMAWPGRTLGLPSEVVVAQAGRTFRVAAADLNRLCNDDPALRAEMLNHYASRFFHLAQIAFCNRVHNLDQQFMRFLLCWVDRSGTSRLDLTHEQIAGLLGVRREAISQAAAKLHRAGMIEARRGSLTVTARETMEQRVCECYGSIVEIHRVADEAPGTGGNAVERTVRKFPLPLAGGPGRDPTSLRTGTERRPLAL